LAHGHGFQTCPKQKLPLQNQLCFQCGKPGHRSTQCTARGVKAATKAAQEDQVSAMCVSANQPSARKFSAAADVERMRGPGVLLLSAFMDRTRFCVLAEGESPETISEQPPQPSVVCDPATALARVPKNHKLA
jgi:hypothetical protein